MNKVRTIIEPEPPPPQHNNMIIPIEPEPPPSSEETQYINDAKYSATIHMARTKLDRDAINNDSEYTPFTNKIIGSIRLNQHLLYLKNLTAPKPTLPPPRTHPIHISTPKGCTRKLHRSVIHDTTWKDCIFKDWVKNSTGRWDIPDPIQPPIPPAPNIKETKVNTASALQSSKFRVMIQSDMGANRCITDNKGIMVDYEDIPAYPVGGIEKEEVAVICTGNGTPKKAY